MGLQFTTFPATTAGTADIKSASVAVQGASVSLWAKTSGFNAATATIILEASNKDSLVDTDWIELTDSLITLAANSTSYGSGVVACPYGFVRVKFIKNANSAGTFESIINFSR